MEDIQPVDSMQKPAELKAKPSVSEERALAMLQSSDKTIFSPGISTAGFAEIRMAQQVPDREVIATTIDEKGLAFTKALIARAGLQEQIETKLEDLRGEWRYPPERFDFIYARLVLHYLKANDLDSVLKNLFSSLRSGGKMFVVVQSAQNAKEDDPNYQYDPETHMTSFSKYNAGGSFKSIDTRYLHTQESIQHHITQAGFRVEGVEGYGEVLYHDYAREDDQISPTPTHLIEVVAVKP